MTLTLACVAATVALAAPARADTIVPDAPPIAQPRRVIREDTPGPLYYRIPSDIVGPMLRDGVGMAIRPTTMDHPGGVAFTVELLGGAAIQLGRGGTYGLWLEAGYAYSRFHDHLAIAGAGPSWRAAGADPVTTPGLAIVPHVVAGSIDGRGAAGVRTSLLGRGWLPLEVAHQVMFVDGHAVHEVELIVTFAGVAGPT